MDCRIIVLGSEGVGKTSLIRQYLFQKFPISHSHTIEDLHKRKVTLPDGTCMNISILDTSGSQEDRLVVETNLNLGDAFMLVYDVSNIPSFHEALKLGEEVISLKGKSVPIVLVGNKTDILQTRRISQGKPYDWLNGKKNVYYLESSAKANFQVHKSFETLLSIFGKLDVELKPGNKKSTKSNCMLF